MATCNYNDLRRLPKDAPPSPAGLRTAGTLPTCAARPTSTDSANGRYPKSSTRYRGFTRKLTRFVSKSSAAASAARGRPWTTRRFSPSTGRLPDRVIDEDQKAPDVTRSGPGAHPSKCVTLSMHPRDALNHRH